MPTITPLLFKPSRPLTLGTELEWQILDPHTTRLKNQSVRLLHAIRKESGSWTHQFKPEAVRNMLEINSSIHESAETLLTELYALQDQVKGVLQASGLALSGGGTHPFETWTEREIFPNRRYLHLHKVYGFLFKRFSVYSQHIHIGCASAQDALYLTHALSLYVPHFIALSAASPFYFGIDTHFDCSRLTVISSFPTSGVMPFMTDWEEFESYFSHLCQVRLINSIKDLYWDIRPKPEFGTVELRICDSPLHLRKAAIMAAYAQALTAFLLDTRPAIDAKMYFAYKFNRFFAMRYGLHALMFDVNTESEQPLIELILKTLALLKPYAKSLGSEDLLAELEALCRTQDSDAASLRQVYKKEKNLAAVTRYAMQSWHLNNQAQGKRQTH